MNYSFHSADGWCFLLTNAEGQYIAGFRLALWRSTPEGDVVGMVAVTPFAPHLPGDLLQLTSVPPAPGHYRHWDDLDSAVQAIISKG